jgi:hypothetical protein
MPSVALVNPRGTTQTVTELGAFEHYLRRGYTPQTGTVADARTAFTGQPDTPSPLETGGTVVAVLAGQNLTTATPAVTFTIPQTHRHLRIAWRARSDTAGAATSLYMRFNADTTTKYSEQRMQANAATITATEAASQAQLIPGVLTAATSTADIAASGTIDLPDYSGTTFAKTYNAASQDVRSPAGGSIYLRHAAGIWNSKAAITSVTLYPQAGNFVAGSSFVVLGSKEPAPF